MRASRFISNAPKAQNGRADASTMKDRQTKPLGAYLQAHSLLQLQPGRHLRAGRASWPPVLPARPFRWLAGWSLG